MKDRFELTKEQFIPELESQANIYRHKATGAEFISIENSDENKVFGISFRTPPKDGTGVAHILEHTVLCGSRKYPVKDPFVQLLKGSLQTFLNAFTYPDRTCYPVASCNLKDFYNLTDVYLDSVFYPRITEDFFKQEGWHYELADPAAPLTCKGVVYNEMKGVYSSPDALLDERSTQSLFPDSVYGLEYGGDPGQIPQLTYEQFKAFHAAYYHPSNARIWFYGDDDPEKRFEILENYLKDFTRLEINSSITLQPDFTAPRRLTETYPAGSDENKAMFTVNWRLPQSTDTEINLALHLLDQILIGTPAAPLRKALIESELGEDLTGGGLEAHLREMSYSIGLKGVDPDDLPAAEQLIFDTLSDLEKNGIDPADIEAALNTMEFEMRENNSGGYPRGLSMMVKALNSWIYDADPLAAVAFETPLAQLKENLKKPAYLENLIRTLLLENSQRSTVELLPDEEMAARIEAEEHARLQAVKDKMSDDELHSVCRETLHLAALQAKPDSPEDLAKIPMLGREDLNPEIRTCPREIIRKDNAEILFHDLFTNGILYFDIGFDLKQLPQELLPWMCVFGNALLEMGTQRTPFVELTRRISAETGGIWPSVLLSASDRRTGCARYFLRAKCMHAKSGNLLGLLQEILTEPDFSDRERFSQIVLENKAMMESAVIPNGHQVVSQHLRRRYNETWHASEQMSGLDALFFLRKLSKQIESDWPSVQATLEKIHRLLINPATATVNVTTDAQAFSEIQPAIGNLLASLPAAETCAAEWILPEFPRNEALTAPAQVNYVGLGIDLNAAGFRPHGSLGVITRYLQTAYLWEKIRVQGGAYGAMCGADERVGVMFFSSYRDPNTAATLDAYRAVAGYLKQLELDETELTRALIGAIGAADKYQLPDARGWFDTVRYLTGITDEFRQQRRDELLATTADDFRAFGALLEKAATDSAVCVLGGKDTLEKSGIAFDETVRVL